MSNREPSCSIRRKPLNKIWVVCCYIWNYCLNVFILCNKMIYLKHSFGIALIHWNIIMHYAKAIVYRTLTYDRCRHSLAMMTPVIWLCDLMGPTTLWQIKISFMKKLSSWTFLESNRPQFMVASTISDQAHNRPCVDEVVRTNMDIFHP